MVLVETEGVRTLKRVKQHLLSEREAFYRQMADGARKQSNFYVADMYMKMSLKAAKALQVWLLEKHQGEGDYLKRLFHADGFGRE